MRRQSHRSAYTRRSVAPCGSQSPSPACFCNDCHTPHALLGKYAVKASNGFRHSFYFTSGRYPDAVEISAASRRVTENACRSCHQEIVAAIESHGDRISCIRCHAEVGHL